MPIRRILCAGAALIALSSCQPPTFDIIAQGGTQRMTFTARGSGSWPFRSEADIASDEITVRDRDRIVWNVTRQGSEACNRRDGKMHPFPLTYGRLPACFEQRVAPAPLRTGRLYRIESDGFRAGSGLFRVIEQTRMLEWEDVEAELKQWPELSAPPDMPGNMG